MRKVCSKYVEKVVEGEGSKRKICIVAKRLNTRDGSLPGRDMLMSRWVSCLAVWLESGYFCQLATNSRTNAAYPEGGVRAGERAVETGHTRNA